MPKGRESAPRDPKALVQAVEDAIGKLRPEDEPRGTGLAATVQVAYDQIHDLREKKKRTWKTILLVLQVAGVIAADETEMNLRAAFAKERRWRSGTLRVKGRLVTRRWGVRSGPNTTNPQMMPAGVESPARAAEPRPASSVPRTVSAAAGEERDMITLADGRQAKRGELVPLTKPEDWAASDHIRYWGKEQSKVPIRPPMVKAEDVETELKRLQQ